LSAAFYILAALGELPIALAGIISELFKPGYRFEVERRLRGGLLSIFFRGRRLRFGKALHFEGVSNIEIGNQVSLYRGVDLLAGPRGRVVIGDGSHVGRHSLVNGIGGAVMIGSQCSISSHVAIFTITNTIGGGIEKGSVVIGDSVLIGTGASILPGVEIGDGATVGAGAVVTKNVAPGEVVVGIPAKAKPTASDN
jgi:acetyltransferase-like isoleucine patch superfamily enzyme